MRLDFERGQKCCTRFISVNFGVSDTFATPPRAGGGSETRLKGVSKVTLSGECFNIIDFVTDGLSRRFSAVTDFVNVSVITRGILIS